MSCWTPLRRLGRDAPPSRGRVIGTALVQSYRFSNVTGIPPVGEGDISCLEGTKRRELITYSYLPFWSSALASLSHARRRSTTGPFWAGPDLCLPRRARLPLRRLLQSRRSGRPSGCRGP